MAFVLLLLGAWPATAQITITNVAPVNVTPVGFSLAAAVSPLVTSSTTTVISIFSDPAGVSNLTGQVSIEYYPLNSGDPTATNSYQGLLSQAALRQDSMGLGLIYARIANCAANTTYYYQVTVTNTNGQSAVYPPSGPLPSVTTAVENSFVLQSQQLLVTLNDANPPGSIILLTTSNSPTILAAVVGDGVPTNQAFFDVNDLIAASGGTNYSPQGIQLFTAFVLGSSPGPTETYDLIFSNNFSVGQAGSVSLGSLAAIISLGQVTMQTGASGSIPISLNSQSALVGLSFVLALPTNLFSAMSVQPTASALGAASLNVLSSNAVQLSFTAAPGQNLEGNQEIAQLNLTAALNKPSASVPLLPQSPQGTNVTAVVDVFSAVAGRVIIVGPQPVLDMQLTGGVRNLVLYGNPGQSYQIQSTTDLASRSWTNFLTVPMTDVEYMIPNLAPTPNALYFRAYVLNADPPQIQARLLGANQSILTYGLLGANYSLQTSSNISGVVVWRPLLNYTLTNSFQFFTNPGNGSPLFYRIKKQ